jgi:hypothetical protein
LRKEITAEIDDPKTRKKFWRSFFAIDPAAILCYLGKYNLLAITAHLQGEFYKEKRNETD